MMRSMFSGVTGLRNHQVKMDVIGNNIANVNTVGFKKSRVTFQDTLSQTMRGAASPQGNRGGTNPMQVGLGMTIASIDTIHSPSSAEYTGNMTDLSIEGDGYFIVGDGLDMFYTRAGNFGFDENGNLINTANGLKVMGWQDTEKHEVPADKSPQSIRSIEIRKGMMIPASATTEINFAKNLNAETENNGTYSLPFKVYDSLGCAHNLTIEFTKTNANEWNYNITFTDSNVTNIANNTGTITFDNDGNCNIPAGGTMTFDLANGADNMSISIDFSGTTQYAKETNVDLSYQNGYPAGTLTDVTTDTTGVITGIFDNGYNRQLAQVALANFDNPAGLIKAGQNMYRYSNNSGEPQIGESGTGGRGAIAPGYLEMSNVDLSEEFTQMIITQRGFQANSRIITTSDEMLQELVNLKR
ncbi:Flagellar hook protein FlgE [Tepidanaerobacter acetatoxydans Re1]|uniref:Flagellar hook protein FlgE n=1 Tax=Tepidanaerobacter acetatoxydans (strain DSM 21804 / JCM 16047 / Re1) TaxID=1209989 RepID=L0RYH8_TEPAE|nr:flagellar hook protein FlgE [Tepidanaerobacter acetatoxydans]CCP26070.1 Flagellar hook protein FlgE [Tepidanaerobacter acetatoxydans Re1]